MSLKHALAVRSDFSLGESMLSPKRIAELAQEKSYDSVALVDTMSVSSMIAFSKALKDTGVKPIIACRLRIVDDSLDKTPAKKRTVPNRTYYLKVYVRNEEGLKALYRLLSLANDSDHFYHVSRLSLNELIPELEAGNLIVSTGDIWNIFHHPEHAQHLERLATAAGRSRTFCELVPANSPLFDTLNKKAILRARESALPLLLTRPIFYNNNSDAEALDVLNVVIGNQKMSAPWRKIEQIKDFGFIGPGELIGEAKLAKARLNEREGFDFCEDAWNSAVLNMQRLVDDCDYAWSKQEVSLPVMAQDESAELVKQIKLGWQKRLLNPQMGYQPDAALLPVYKERLVYELDVLKTMGFERYFLLVQDLTNWSKRSEIMVGPGRGSVGGSLIAYLLGITDVDPIRFDLIFERFINPDRLDLPDADLDFMSSRRHEVIAYLEQRYGTENVAGISNYTTLASAGALRDVSRVHSLPPMDYACSKLVPSVHGKSHTLEQAAAEVPEIESFALAYTDVWRYATQLQGVMRSLGRHAAGIVVAGEPIVNRAVMERRSGEPTVNWDKRVVEDQGLVKMDILGLSTLDVLSIAKDKIKQSSGFEVLYEELPLDDPIVLEAFGKGDTIGVFQFESPGMRKLLRDLAINEPLTFNDIAAATALYRPGPMDSGLMEEYVMVKQGNRQIIHEHPNMEPALAPTYGVIIYQEQVMRVAQDLAGFSMADADHLRKAMGKKDKDMMQQQRQKWITGCQMHSALEERVAGGLFDKIEAFAGYSFNRSHAVEYSIISYWALWVKTHYPAEFYAASMSVLKEDKLSGLVEDARMRNILVYPPDINLSGMTFEQGYDAKRDTKVLYAPFNRAKGLSDNTARAILEARDKEGGRFDSFGEFFDSIERRKVNKRAQEVLGKIGAFAELEFTARDIERQPSEFPHIEVKQLAARHPDRLRDQIELMPGLIVDVVKADRKIEADKFVKARVIDMAQQYRNGCDKCTLAGGKHLAPKMGSSPKVMVVSDCPTWQEDQKGELMDNKSGIFVKSALKRVGLTLRDCYFTTLVKSIKDGKQLTNEQINGCSGYLKQEIEWLKPPVIIALGSATIRHLVPTAKGGFAELAGQVHYLPQLDASVVFGINPQMIHFDPDKQEVLNAAFEKVAEIIR